MHPLLNHASFAYMTNVGLRFTLAGWYQAAKSAKLNRQRTLVDFNSRSYAEDVTSVTSGASQGPHSFNLVFVCLFVCVTAGAIPYLSRICDYKGSTGLYITAVHNICRLLYLSRTVPIFVVLCIRLPDVEGDLERNRETRRKIN